MAKKLFSVVFILFGLLFTQFSNCFADSRNAIIGNWVGDPDTYLADPKTIADVQSQEAAMQDAYVSFLTEYYMNMKVDITIDLITIDIAGAANAASKYKVIESTGNSVTVQCDDGTKFFIDITDTNHIKLSTEENAVKNTLCYLKKEQ